MESLHPTPDTSPDHVTGYDNMPLGHNLGVHPKELTHHWRVPIEQVDQGERSSRLTDDAMELILAHCGDHPPLSTNTTLDLHRAAKRGDLDAKERLFLSYQRFVVHIAKRYFNEARHLNLPFEDVVQNGMIGLMRGVDKADPFYSGDSKKPFTSYVGKCISQHIRRRMPYDGLLMRVPNDVYDEAKGHVIAASELSKALGREPSAIEVAEYQGLITRPPEARYYEAADDPDEFMEGPYPESRVQRAMREHEREYRYIHEQVKETLNKVKKFPVRLDGFVRDEDGEWTTRGETMPDPREHSTDPTHDIAAETERLRQLDEILELAPYRARRVLELRYGLNGEHPRTLDEVGRLFDVTRERIRQIENQTLKALLKEAEEQAIPYPTDVSTAKPATYLDYISAEVRGQSKEMTFIRNGLWLDRGLSEITRQQQQNFAAAVRQAKQARANRLRDDEAALHDTLSGLRSSWLDRMMPHTQELASPRDLKQEAAVLREAEQKLAAFKRFGATFGRPTSPENRTVRQFMKEFGGLAAGLALDSKQPDESLAAAWMRARAVLLTVAYHDDSNDLVEFAETVRQYA